MEVKLQVYDDDSPGYLNRLRKRVALTELKGNAQIDAVVDHIMEYVNGDKTHKAKVNKYLREEASKKVIFGLQDEINGEGIDPKEGGS